MHHPKGECKVRDTFETEAVRRTSTKVDSVRQALTLDSMPRPLDHLRLNIQGDDAPRGPNKIRQSDAEVTQAATDIDRRITWGDEVAQDRARPVQQLTEWVIEGIPTPPRARVRTKEERPLQERYGSRLIIIVVVHTLPQTDYS